MPAMSLPVAVSMPSNPGEEFTSSSNGPFDDLKRSTPATFNLNVLDALGIIVK